MPAGLPWGTSKKDRQAKKPFGSLISVPGGRMEVEDIGRCYFR